VNLTTTGANIGNGSTSTFTAGYFFLYLDLDVIQRYVMSA
jgi:hypothetical protein